MKLLLLESSKRDQSEDGIRTTEPQREDYEREGRGSRRWRVHGPEEESDQRSEASNHRVLRRSHSMRSRVTAAGASQLGHSSLDLGELQQVLQDEELARKLQEEEERQLRRSTNPSPPKPVPVGDVRLAQVAQDEEIARFMQKQEIKSKRRSRELDGPGLWKEHRAMMNHHDRGARAGTQIIRAERHDSEGLSSPTEDCPLDQLPPSPTSSVISSLQIRNIAEELDPTFQARRQSTELLRTEPTGCSCAPLPAPHTGIPDFLDDPTFIPPTKRQTDKSGRNKPKDKRENCKQQ